MNTYKITLRTGQSFNAQDKRALEALSEELCTSGFVIVQRRASAYSADAQPVSVFERAVASIEPA